MALIRYPEGQQRSGSSGGLTFSHNRFGAYIRPRTVPVNPNSTAQQSIRASFALFATGWQALTDAQRAAWDTYAENVTWQNAFGDPAILTGFNWYVLVNTLRNQAGLTTLTAAPIVLAMGVAPVIGAISGDISLNQISVAFTNTEAWATAVGGALYIQQGLAQPPSRTFFASPYRRLGVVLGAASPPTSPALFTPTYPISVGNRTYLRFRALYPDGRVSPPIQNSFLGVA